MADPAEATADAVDVGLRLPSERALEKAVDRAQATASEVHTVLKRPADTLLKPTFDRPAAPGKDQWYATQISKHLQELERVEPAKANEFLEDAQKAAASGTLDAVLGVWAARVEHLRRTQSTPKRVAEAPASVPAAPTPPPEPIKAVSVLPTSGTEPAAVPVASKSPATNVATGSLQRMTIRMEPQGVAENPAQRYRPDDPQAAQWGQQPPPAIGSEPIQTVSHKPIAESASAPKNHEWRRRLEQWSAGDVSRAVLPVAGWSAVDQRVWRDGVTALHQYFGDDPATTPASKIQTALERMQEVVSALQERADLTITQPLFCKKVTSFGVCEEFERAEFQAGQKVVVYWEAQNFASVESRDGFRTRMEATFEIFDASNQRRHQFVQRFSDDLCRRRRQDYFSAVAFALPKELAAGDYLLKVTVADKTTEKIAENHVRFVVLP